MFGEKVSNEIFLWKILLRVLRKKLNDYLENITRKRVGKYDKVKESHIETLFQTIKKNVQNICKLFEISGKVEHMQQILFVNYKL